MSSGSGRAAELSRRARTQETRERIASLERELASLDELRQHLAVDVQSAEERLDAAQARCSWLSDRLAVDEQRNQELDAQLAAASAQLTAAEAERQSTETLLGDRTQELQLLRARVRDELCALQTRERKLAEVVESIRRLGYAAEVWAESLR